MAVKKKKTFSLDTKLVNEFYKICKENNLEYSAALEDLMRVFIEKRGQILLDDIYAPRIDKLLSRTMEKFSDQIKGMISNVNVDVLGSMYLQTAIYKKNMLQLENTINEYFPDQLLQPGRASVMDDYKAVEDANNLIPGARNAARKQLGRDQKERAEARKQAEQEKAQKES